MTTRRMTPVLVVGNRKVNPSIPKCVDVQTVSAVIFRVKSSVLPKHRSNDGLRQELVGVANGITLVAVSDGEKVKDLCVSENSAGHCSGGIGAPNKIGSGLFRGNAKPSIISSRNDNYLNGVRDGVVAGDSLGQLSTRFSTNPKVQHSTTEEGRWAMLGNTVSNNDNSIFGSSLVNRVGQLKLVPIEPAFGVSDLVTDPSAGETKKKSQGALNSLHAMHIALLLLILPAFSARAYDVASSNRIYWADVCGIPGGIPFRTTTNAVLEAGVAAGDINTAIANASSNQVVFLSNGVYNLSANINFATRHGRTLRGAGTNKTILNFTAGKIVSDQYAFAGAAALSSGSTKGSTQVVFTATPNAQISVGNLMLIQQDDDTNFTFRTTGPGQSLSQMVRVLTKSGTTVTFEPPLFWWITNNPTALYLSGGPGLTLATLEDMTITNSGTATAILELVGTRQFGIRNVEFVGAADMNINLVDCLQTEIRTCTIKAVDNWPNQADGFGVFLDGACFTLIEDCIFWKTGNPILQKNAASGNAILFNYFDYTAFAGVDRQLPDINVGHGAHNMMCLIEGNDFSKFQHDSYHGSASHMTLFRNRIHGTNGSSSIVNWKCPVDILRGTYYNSVVGNILGDSSWTPDEFSATGSFDFSDSAIYRLGYPNSGNGSLTETVDNRWIDDYPWFNPYPDNKVTNTTVFHGNYDYFTDSQIWLGGEDTTLSNSFYYGSHPTNSCVKWPPFDPANPSASHATNIQAGHRFWFGTNFPAVAAQLGPPTRKQGIRGIRLRKF